MRAMFFSVLTVGFGAVLRVSIDENADVDHNVTRHEVGMHSPANMMRRGMLTAMLGKIVCSGNCSRNVCKSGSDAESLQRYDHKQEKLRNLAKYLAEKKCTYRLVGGGGEFRDQMLPRTCAAHWAEFDQRMMAFESCSQVSKVDESSLSAAVWGLGSQAFKAAHESLDTFMREILYLIHTAYNGNQDIQSMLQEGDCTLNLNILGDEMRAAHERKEAGVPLQTSLEAVDMRVFGPNCNFETAKMPWMYLRMRLLKSIRAMVHGLVENLVHGSEAVNIESLLTHSVDEASASDDSEVAAEEQRLLPDGEHEFEPTGTSLVDLGNEPVVTTVTVTIGTGIIIAALVGGFAVLAIIGLVLRALMMTRRITFKDRTNA